MMMMMMMLYGRIVRRPWPNFVCKGRHTSSVILVLVLIGAYVVLSVNTVPCHWSGSTVQPSTAVHQTAPTTL